MSEFTRTMAQGAKEISPILLGVLPFGLICGAVGVGVGMSEWQSIGLSTIVFAGASQLAATQLMAENSPIWVVILTGMVINARFLMYSASIAPHFNGTPPLKKAGLAYLLTDQAYAIGITRFTDENESTSSKIAYYLGAGLLMYFGFNVTTVVGAYVGALVPAAWNLDFAIPLTFTALIIPAVKDRPTLAAAFVAGGISLAAYDLPYNLGLLTAAISGILAGYAFERKQDNV